MTWQAISSRYKSRHGSMSSTDALLTESFTSEAVDFLDFVAHLIAHVVEFRPYFDEVCDQVRD